MTQKNRSATRNALLSTVALFTLTSLTQAAYAEFSNVRLTGEIKGQSITTTDNDLGENDEGMLNSQSLQGRLRLTGQAAAKTTFQTEVRGVANAGDGGGEDPVTGEQLGAEDFLELREAWIQQSEVLGSIPTSVRVGRQRIFEPYGFWWNRNFDAARVFYDTTLFKGFLALGENLTSYRTTGDDFNSRDENVTRLLGEGSWQYRLNHFFETRFVAQHDHSGTEPVGSLVRNNDRDDDDGELFWTGVRFTGALPGHFPNNPARTSTYRVDVAGLAGEADTQTNASSGITGFRTVTGSTSADVRAFAVDAAVNVLLPIKPDPVLTLGYAFGSGDNDPLDGTDHTFRQTGLDSNYSFLGLSSGGLPTYGSVLRPDLSNLHILTAGIGAPVFKKSDLSFFYHYYALAEEGGGLPVASINSPLSGTSRDIGHAGDIILNVNLTDELNLKLPYVTRVDFKTTLGAFVAGDAFVGNSEDVALRGLAELRFRF